MSRSLTSEEKELVELGIQSQFLLQNDTFSKAVNTLSEQIANTLLNTKAEDAAGRERLYLMHVCLQELVGILKARMAAKDNIEAMVNQADDEDSPLNSTEET